MTNTERTIRAILKYTGAAESHSALSTVHMLANEALEEYMKEQGERSMEMLLLELKAVRNDAAIPNNAHLHEL